MQVTASRSIITHQIHIKRRIAVLIVMIAMSDFLVFNHTPGFNLFLLSVSLTAVLLLAASRPLRPLPAAGYLCISALAAAPLVEAPTLGGSITAILAVIYVALAVARLVPERQGAIALVLLRFLPVIPIKLLRDFRSHVVMRSSRAIFGTTLGALAGWALPLGLGLIFLLLFRAANPLIEISLRNLDLSFLLRFFDLSRLTFWLVAASIIWAMMRPRLIRKRPLLLPKEAAASGVLDNVLDHVALVRSLCVFNLLFALQTALDLTYLWGGADLPSGMSHSQYAHRGAYPLVATALLAAAFVLIAMRRGGPGDHSRLIRGLVLAWIMQNVLLCLSSILRLDLYVEAYSLTGLRIAAGIWMGLVATGLFFILLRITLRRSNEWLISMNLAALVAVIYVAAFYDFSGFIARFNVENGLQRPQSGASVDLYYLTSLGPSAIPALDVYLASAPDDTCLQQQVVQARNRLADDFTSRFRNWRSWSYRAARMEKYLQSTALLKRKSSDIANGIEFLERPNGAPHPCRR
jgi:hypothetical protein